MGRVILNRRQFLQGSLGLVGLGLLAGCGQLVLPWQRAPKAPPIGILSLGTQASIAAHLETLRSGLRDLGYVEGRDFVLEPRYAEGHPERYAELAPELVQLGAAIIVANEPTAVLAAQRASATVPIVMAGASETPVERGLIAGFARPGGRVTGLAFGTPGLAAKRLQLLKEAVHDLARVAFINDLAISPIEANPKVGLFSTAAAALGLGLEVANLPAPEEFEALFADLARKQVGGIFIDGSPNTFAQRLRLSELAIRHRLSSIWQGALGKDAALLAYGANSSDLWRRSATYIDKLLKGASAADRLERQPLGLDPADHRPAQLHLGLEGPVGRDPQPLLLLDELRSEPALRQDQLPIHPGPHESVGEGHGTCRPGSGRRARSARSMAGPPRRSSARPL
jgi:putative ABC transport system substrate-binding protein